MKYEYTINHIAKFDRNGSVFRNTINIKESTFKKLKGRLNKYLGQQKFKHCPNTYENFWLSCPMERDRDIVFMNLTQRDFFNKILKLKLSDANTCFFILNSQTK